MSRPRSKQLGIITARRRLLIVLKSDPLPWFDIETIRVCRCPWASVAGPADKCSRCKTRFKVPPGHDVMIAAFKLGGWEAVKDVARGLLDEPV